MNFKMNFKIIISMMIVGVIFVILGFSLLFGYLPGAIRDKVNKEVYITEDNSTDTYKRFANLTVLLHYKTWAIETIDTKTFDGENISSIRFRLRGPYVFDEKRTKTQIEFSPDGNNVTYLERKDYTFNKELSCSGCSENDRVTIYNPYHTMGQQFLDGLMKFPSLRETLGSLNYTAEMRFVTFDKNPDLGQSILNKPDHSKMTVDTGKSDISKVATLINYNHLPYLETWYNSRWGERSYCNQLMGTDGTQFQPDLTGDETLWVYEPMLCTSLYLRNTMPNVEVKGIPTLRYVIDEENFMFNMNHLCYCDQQDYPLCVAGMLNLKKCYSSKDYEMVASPKFFYVNHHLFDMTGMGQIIGKDHLTREDMATILDVEPMTGITLQATKRLMLSVKVRKNAVPALANLKDDWQLAPILLLEQVVQVDDDNANMLKDKLAAKRLATGGLITLTVIGFIIMAVAGFFLVQHYRSS